MQSVVIDGAGFIGSTAIDALIAAGCTVTCFNNFVKGYHAWSMKGGAPVNGITPLVII